MHDSQILLFVISSLVVIMIPGQDLVLGMINRISGTVLIGLGLKLALEQR